MTIKEATAIAIVLLGIGGCTALCKIGTIDSEPFISIETQAQND